MSLMTFQYSAHVTKMSFHQNERKREKRSESLTKNTDAREVNAFDQNECVRGLTIFQKEKNVPVT